MLRGIEGQGTSDRRASRPSTPPMLMAVPDGRRHAPAPAEVAREVYLELAAKYDELIRTPGLDDADRASLRRQRNAALRAAGLRTLVLAQGL